MKRIGPLLPIGSGDPAVHHGARRRTRRYPLNADVTIIEPVRTCGVALNVSAGGMRIMIVDGIPLGEPCLLELSINEDRRWTERARVIWSQEHSDGWVVGLEFLDVTWTLPSDSDHQAA